LEFYTLGKFSEYLMTFKIKLFRGFLAITIILGLSLSNIKLTKLSAQDVYAAPSVRTDAVVVVNTVSANYTDFQHFIQPYLDNFGIPYATLDIAYTDIGSDISDYAVIIIGHRSLDVNHLYLDSTEQSNITNAVNAGTGLVNFDNDLASGGVGYYDFIQSLFSFAYITPATGTGVKFGAPTYITNSHQLNEVISTGSMTMAGISTLPANDTALAWTGTQPFLTITNYGQGRAVQWGTYSWMSNATKGPVYGLDDLVWKSIVWAARKPFVMQGMPPFMTMRVDDVSGPMGWANIATDLGYKPWLGMFYQDIDASEAAAISAWAYAGKATASVHAKTTSDFFYYDHNLKSNIPDDDMIANYVEATVFHTNNNIPISKYVVPHFYEIGTNAFEGLSDWGIEFVNTQMLPGDPYGAPWLNLGPYRFFETLPSTFSEPGFYADYLTISGHPNQFFNCVTEIRDDAGYEWYPSTDVPGTIGRGTRQTIRALDSMVLATLFTHEYYLQDIPTDSWTTILETIKTNIEPYGPIYVTMDYACQYVRAIHNSNISASSYDLGTNILTTSLSGATDMVTKFYVFTQDGTTIRQIMVDVPTFNPSTVVNFTIPGALDHIGVTPASASVLPGGTQSFSALGYDAGNHPIPNLPIRWSVVNGGGSINMDGVFTAGSLPGSYSNTIRASYNSMNAYASVNVDASISTGVVTGWNMVAVPVQAASMQLNVLFPDIIPPAYYYTTSYQPVQATGTLATGTGYWMYFTSAHAYALRGQPVSPQDIPVNAGWNMIGPFDTPVLVSAITSTPAGILLPPLYGYSTGYSLATTLQPGAAYWAYATQAGTLHLAGGGGLAMNVPQASLSGPDLPQDFRLPIEVRNGQGTMTAVLGVSPQGSAGFDPGLDQLAPPPSPAGAFDVRLANEGQQFLVDVRSSQPGAYTFTLHYSPMQASEDIVLRWDAEALAGLGKFEIVDLTGGDVYTLDMSTRGELVIQPGSVLYQGLRIRVTSNPPSYPMFLPLLVR
jgi:hypothetical protein